MIFLTRKFILVTEQVISEDDTKSLKNKELLYLVETQVNVPVYERVFQVHQESFDEVINLEIK